MGITAIQKYQKATDAISLAVLVVDWTPQMILQKLKGVDTVRKVFEVDTPSLWSISKQCSPEKAMAWLEAWIVEMLDFINVSQSMNMGQIKLTAELIMERYACLTVADIQLVFKRAMAGDYGPFFGRIDGTIILGWLRAYFDERCDTAEVISQHENQRHKSDQQILTFIAPQIADLYQAEVPQRLSENQKYRKTREVYAAYLTEKNRREYNNSSNQNQNPEP